MEGTYHDNFEGHTNTPMEKLRIRLAEVEAQRDMFAAIGKEFCERAERGEIRSKYTYRKLKEALAKLEAPDE